MVGLTVSMHFQPVEDFTFLKSFGVACPLIPTPQTLVSSELHALSCQHKLLGPGSWGMRPPQKNPGYGPAFVPSDQDLSLEEEPGTLTPWLEGSAIQRSIRWGFHDYLPSFRWLFIHFPCNIIHSFHSARSSTVVAFSGFWDSFAAHVFFEGTYIFL